MKLSLVVIAYNMARELPRTLYSLAPVVQRGVSHQDYEVILVDNGSDIPLDTGSCAEHYHRLLPNLRIVRVGEPTVSPVPAINEGLRLASGELIGVMIDGARIASPGLLATALEASRLHQRPVIGTLAFHLGPAVQMESVHQGYNQEVEDRLLSDIRWEEDGYRLFDISVPAGSSSGGWFVIPAETNALFLTRRQWDDLGGYDPGFVTPGGGLANLDTWSRACADPEGLVVMLLGEATFHQVHGGVATNALRSPWGVFHEEYKRLRGHSYTPPQVNPRFYGTFRPSMLPNPH